MQPYLAIIVWEYPLPFASNITQNCVYQMLIQESTYMEDPLPKKGFKSLGDSKSGPKAIIQSPNYIFLGLSLSTTSLVQSFSLNKK